MGFEIDDKQLKRAGLDYWNLLDITYYDNLSDFFEKNKSGEFYYWEHFGLIDDSGYRKNAMLKLQLYASHGIFPTINLITTYETKHTPLNPEYVNLLVSHYFINV